MNAEFMARKLIKKHESLSLELYLCPAGKLTIGYGHNIEDNGITPTAAEFMLTEQIKISTKELYTAFNWYHHLSDARQAVLLGMHYNLGLPRLLSFRKMIAALSQKNYMQASSEMLDSKWARQVGIRARRLATMMASDRMPDLR